MDTELEWLLQQGFKIDIAFDGQTYLVHVTKINPDRWQDWIAYLSIAWGKAYTLSEALRMALENTKIEIQKGEK